MYEGGGVRVYYCGIVMRVCKRYSIPLIKPFHSIQKCLFNTCVDQTGKNNEVEIFILKKKQKTKKEISES